MTEFQEGLQTAQNQDFYNEQELDFIDFQKYYKENQKVTDLNLIGLYAIYDKVAGMFSNVFNNTRVEVIERDLANIIKNDKTHNYSVCPENYDLFELGKFNVVTGTVIVDKRFICNLDHIKTNIDTKL